MRRTNIYSLCWSTLLIAFVVLGPMGHIFAAEKVLKIGTTMPLSGPAAAWGLGLSRMSEFFAEDVNGRGGLKIGNDIYKVQTIVYDNKGQPAQAAADTNRLVHEDKAQYLIGGVIAGIGMAQAPILQSAKVVTTHAWWGKEMLGPDKPYFFRQTLSQYELAPALYKWIAKNNPQIKSLAQINPNDLSGRETAGAIADAAKTNGLKVVAEEFYDRGTTDMSPFLLRMLEKKPDLIEVGVSSPGDGAVIVKRLHELGYKGAKAWTCGTSPGQTIKVCGADAAEGLWFAFSLDPYGPNSTPETNALAKRYRDKFNEDLSSVFLTSYAMLEIFTRAMVQAGTTDVDKVLKAVEDRRTFSTSFGPLGLTGSNKYGIDHQFVHRAMVTQAKDGKLVEVDWLPLSGLGTHWRKR